jgi:hypothetical protein
VAAFGQAFLSLSRFVVGFVLVGIVVVSAIEAQAERRRYQMPEDIRARIENQLWLQPIGIQAKVVGERYGFYSWLRCPHGQTASFRLESTHPVHQEFLMCCDLKVDDRGSYPVCDTRRW